MKFLIFLLFLLLGIKSAAHDMQLMKEASKIVPEACKFLEPLVLCYEEQEKKGNKKPKNTTDSFEAINETSVSPAEEQGTIQFSVESGYSSCTEKFFSTVKKEPSTLKNPIIKTIAISIMLNDYLPPIEKGEPTTTKGENRLETFAKKKITSVLTDYRCDSFKTSPDQMELKPDQVELTPRSR